MTSPPEKRDPGEHRGGAPFAVGADPAPTTSQTDALAYRYEEGPYTRETVVSVFGGASRTGPWSPPEETRAVAGFGDVVLDFTQAELPAGVTEVDAYAIFGKVEIRVPASLEVELSGLALLGNVVHRSGKTGKTRQKLRRWLRLPEPPARVPDNRADADALLSVRGTAFFGDVVVTVV